MVKSWMVVSYENGLSFVSKLLKNNLLKQLNIQVNTFRASLETLIPLQDNKFWKH